ncbi:MAG: cytochrome [Rhodospirillales bacterium]|nr:cytochrome [Rhodospirillales bacterium]
MKARPPVTDWATDFDHMHQDWTQDPYPIWQDLRQRCPVAHTDRFEGAYLPVRYADIREIAYDPAHFSSRRIVIRDERLPLVSFPPITSDPPDHRAQRAVLLPLFTPAAMAPHEAAIRRICRGLVDRFADKGTCDGAADYAQEITVAVTAMLLGISSDDGDLFRRWLNDLLVVGTDDPALVMRTHGEMAGFFMKEIALRRANPGQDIISRLLEARIDEAPLDDAQLVGMVRLLLIAGIDTTWSALGSCLLHLATHADDRRRLVADPSLMPTAIEELLRAYSPVSIAREIVADTEVGGCPFKAGQMVLLSFAAANRDPEAFPDADKVVLDRAENRHAAFGLGIHRCIGSHLARLEMTIALEEWLARIPEFSLAPDAIVTWSAGAVRGPRQLPLVF